MSENVLQDTHNWFERAVPLPNQTNVHTQIGVHFEEVAEMLASIDLKVETYRRILRNAEHYMRKLSQILKTEDFILDLPDEKRQEFLDAICDQMVTAVGSAYMLGMDPVGALNEVNRSNWSKFKDGFPLFDENKKILKGPSYSKPDLTPFI